ncbi:hypothetical protein CSHISOI_11763, partial [Colletotrichum shisoi]
GKKLHRQEQHRGGAAGRSGARPRTRPQLQPVPDGGEHLVRRLPAHAGALEPVPEQDREARAVPAHLYGRLGRHIGRHGGVPQLRGPPRHPLPPRLRRGRLLPRVPVLPELLVHARGARPAHDGAVHGVPHLGRLLRAHLGRHHGQHGRRPRAGRVAVAVPHRGRRDGRRGVRGVLCAAQLPAHDVVARRRGDGARRLAAAGGHWRGRLDGQRRADVLARLQDGAGGCQDVDPARPGLQHRRVGLHHQLLPHRRPDAGVQPGRLAAPHVPAVRPLRDHDVPQRVARRPHGRAVPAHRAAALRGHGGLHPRGGDAHHGAAVRVDDAHGAGHLHGVHDGARVDQQLAAAAAGQAGGGAGVHQRGQQLQQHLRELPVPKERRAAVHGGLRAQLRRVLRGRLRGDGAADGAGPVEPQAGEGR